MRKINAVIHCDENGAPVHPSKATQTKYMWFMLVNGQVMSEQGEVFSPTELTQFFHASDPDAKAFRREIYPLTDISFADLDYGSSRVHVEEWTCPVCRTHNRHIDDNPAPPVSSICRHCKTHLTADDIEEFDGVCWVEIDLNTMNSKIVKE